VLLVQRHRALGAQHDLGAVRVHLPHGVGPLGASAAIATVGDFRQFASGAQFGAWLGLVPRQHSSGGKTRSGWQKAVVALANKNARRVGRPADVLRHGGHVRREGAPGQSGGVHQADEPRRRCATPPAG
jgi:transposase